MVDYTDTINALKEFFIAIGWEMARSPKYLHKDVDGRKYRVNFSKLAVRIERKGIGAWSSQWQNIRSAYYKDIGFVNGKPVFGNVSNDVFTELRTIRQPKEILEIVQPNQANLNQLEALAKKVLNKTEK